MKKFIYLLLCCSLICQSSYSYAQSKIENNLSIPSPDGENEEDVGKALSPMKKGQKAPFTGVLFSSPAAAEIIVELESFQEKVQIEVDNAIKLQQINCKKEIDELKIKSSTDKKILETRIEGNLKVINNLNLELKKANEKAASGLPSFFWFGIGTVSGIAITVVTAYAISQATK